MVRMDLACKGSRCKISKGNDGPGCPCYDGLSMADAARKERGLRESEEGAPSMKPLVPLPPVCLYVPHQGEEKLVGKLLEHRIHGAVFYHSHGKGQRHEKHDCPSPIDEDVLAALAGWDVTYCYCYERDTQPKPKTGTLRRITVAVARQAPAELYAGRLRRFPPEQSWVRLPGVTTKQGGRHLTLFDQAELPILREMWTDRKIVLAPVPVL